MPFFLRQNCLRLPRQTPHVAGFSERFPAPYDLLKGRLEPAPSGAVFYKGQLRRTDTRWGRLWQADFSNFTTTGSYQIETDSQISPPFAIRERLYDRIILGYLTFLKAQRCGCAIFGVHAACHLDDGILDTDGSPHDATGGWHDAGDFRKWLAFTLPHIEALLSIREHCDDLRREAMHRTRCWRSYAGAIASFIACLQLLDKSTKTSQVDALLREASLVTNTIGGLKIIRAALATPAITAGPTTSQAPATSARSAPLITRWCNGVSCRCRRVAALHLPANEARECAAMAKRAADYGTRRGHDGRTLFLAAELRARLEMRILPEAADDAGPLLAVAQRLLDRQVLHRDGLAGFFLEEETAKDAFRSIAFAAEPVFALLRLWELRSRFGSGAFAEQACTARDCLCGTLSACRQHEQSVFVDSVRRLPESPQIPSVSSFATPERVMGSARSCTHSMRRASCTEPVPC